MVVASSAVGSIQPAVLCHSALGLPASAACISRLSFVRTFVEPAAVGSVFADTMSVPPLLQQRRSRHRTCRRELG